MTAAAPRVERLTEEAFAPFGRLLSRPARPADIDQGRLGYWHALEGLGLSDRPVWGYLEVRRRPQVVAELERHCRAREVFIPVDGVSVMPFAVGGSPDDAAARPDPATMRLFRVEPGTALIVDRGIWHAPGFPVGTRAGFLLVLEEATPSADLDCRAVGPYAFEI